MAELSVLEDEPRPEPAHVPVCESRAVVQLEHGALVRHRGETEAPGHAQVNKEREPALEPEEEILPAPLDRADTVSFQLLHHLEEIVWARQPGVEDLHPRERPPLQSRCELRADRLDLR